MRVLEEEAFTFDDVLLVPQYSVVASRSDVVLTTRLSRNIEIGCPILAANMDTISSLEMAKALSNYGAVCPIHRFQSPEEQVKFAVDFSKWLSPNWHSLPKEKELGMPICVTIGVGPAAKERLNILMEEYPFDCVFIDIAHGHCKQMMDTLDYCVQRYPEVDFIPGNIATPEAAFDLAEAGASAIKCGIGPGCLAAGTRVLMADSTYKDIEDIKEGNRVISGTGKSVSVSGIRKSGIRNVRRVRHTAFYKETYVTPDHRFLCEDLNSSGKANLSSKGHTFHSDKEVTVTPRKSEYLWKQIKDFKQDVFLLPKKIEFELPENFNVSIKDSSVGEKYPERYNETLYSNYNLGYIFGTFLSNGKAILTIHKNPTRETVVWSFDANEMPIAKKLASALEKETGVCPKIVESKNENTIKIELYSGQRAPLFQDFGERTTKNLPLRYRCLNADYNKGLLDGLIGSDDSVEEHGKKNFSNTSVELIELFNTTYYLVHGSFPNNRLTKDFNVVNPLEIKDTSIYIDTYDIEVECLSHSFIANNAIVHNSFCSTRLVAGAGVPQLSAIMECAEICTSKGIPLIADGGIKTSGDIVKGLAAGAHTVMLGGLLAGCKEAPGETVRIDGNLFKIARGMASSVAQHGWKGAEYEDITPEGIETPVPYKSDVGKTLNRLVGGIRSGFTYCGAKNIDELHENATFRFVSISTRAENIPHKNARGLEA
jgi:IMP dehydrogenase/GMP reductase/intein/homing endonuclease